MTLTENEIETIVKWMNSYEQLRGTVMPIRFKQAFTNIKPFNSEKFKLEEDRFISVKNFIKRYINLNLTVPTELINEYNNFLDSNSSD